MSDGGWTETDRLLSMALTIDEESKCGGCGHYVDEAWNPDADGWFEADDSIVCAACAAKERHSKDHQHREPGQLLRAYDVRIEGGMKSLRRAQDAPREQVSAAHTPKGDATVA